MSNIIKWLEIIVKKDRGVSLSEDEKNIRLTVNDIKALITKRNNCIKVKP